MDAETFHSRCLPRAIFFLIFFSQSSLAGSEMIFFYINSKDIFFEEV